MEIISRKTKGAFEDYLSTHTLREIESYFDNRDINPMPLPAQSGMGQRRNLILQYYAAIDWLNVQSVNRILNVFEDILNYLATPSILYDNENSKVWFNKLVTYLKRDHYAYENGSLTRERDNFLIQNLLTSHQPFSKKHFDEYIGRINSSIEEDPRLAIGSTKELVESTLKTVLSEMEVEFEKDADIPKLLKQVQKTLDLVPDDVDDSKRGCELIKVLLNNLGQVVIKIAELRNLYGTGHGAERKRTGLNERHARLIAGAGITLSTFLLETLDLKKQEKLLCG